MSQAAWAAGGAIARRMWRPLLLLVAGAVFGPVLFVLATSFSGEDEQWAHLFAADELVENYDQHNLPVQATFSTIHDNTIADCGYDEPSFDHGDEMNPRIVLNPKLNANWNPLTGYMDLYWWRSGQYHDLTRFERGRVLAAKLPLYSLRALKGCIDMTALSPVCVAIVAGSLREKGYEKAGRSPPPVDLSRENKTICRYLDGVAARRNLPLPKSDF